MAIGIDTRFMAAKETTYDTRVTPSRGFIIAEDAVSYEHGQYQSVGLGGGRWQRTVLNTTQRGSGSYRMEVPTVGFGFWLDLLHSNTVTPAQQGTTAAYLQTHTLNTSPTKSISVQVQKPPTSSATLLPYDYTGVMMSQIEFSWEPAAVLLAAMTLVARSEDISQSLVTPSTPSFELFSFKGGSISIGGTPVADVTGGGSITVGANLRDDVYALGTGGKIAKPTESDRPEATGQITADFTDNTHYQRVVNESIADVVLKFQGSSAIAGSYFPFIEVTVPDCRFNQPSPQVSGPGPVTQQISFSASSATGAAPTIKYMSADTSV